MSEKYTLRDPSSMGVKSSLTEIKRFFVGGGGNSRSVICSVEALLCLLMLAGTIYMFYSRDSTGQSHLTALRLKEDGTFEKSTDTVGTARAADTTNVKFKYSDPHLGISCVSSASKGERCEDFAKAYGIPDVARLKQMNNGLKCPQMEPGIPIYIRRDQGCGTTCTKDFMC
ncbi:hypothetical protein BV898_18858 [Hypsibius exemplaris]|uniref:LysM domain-containing protein n=1 Tax=Hypsibius exemplaris TaxID=2072580 RepID=A0A9X6RP86_HYPEX|nr:hypothetical protein BV898_18858 [Hypsibius exemplaris]